jgi:hypothetical protein
MSVSTLEDPFGISSVCVPRVEIRKDACGTDGNSCDNCGSRGGDCDTTKGVCVGGGAVGCKPLPTVNAQSASYSNAPAYEGTFAYRQSQSDAGSATLSFEVIWAVNGIGTGTTLGTRNLASEPGYNRCKFCSVLTLRSVGCTSSACDQTFYANVGTMTVTSATRADAGSFAATITNGIWTGWNLSNDAPILDGGCFTTPSVSINTNF